MRLDEHFCAVHGVADKNLSTYLCLCYAGYVNFCELWRHVSEHPRLLTLLTSKQLTFGGTLHPTPDPAPMLERDFLAFP